MAVASSLMLAGHPRLGSFEKVILDKEEIPVAGTRDGGSMLIILLTSARLTSQCRRLPLSLLAGRISVACVMAAVLR